jgi:hypothetical protein
MRFIEAIIEIAINLLAWIYAERKELSLVATAVATVVVLAGGVINLTVTGDELLKRVWECQDEIDDHSVEGRDFCLDLLTKPAPLDDGC